MRDIAECWTFPRRHLRFSLASLFLAVAVVACVAWLSAEWSQVSRRNEMRDWIASKGGVIVPVDDQAKESDLTKPGAFRIGRLRRMFGDEVVELVMMPRSTPADDLRRIEMSFQELAPAIGVFRTPVLVNHHGGSSSP